jgi:periplasmic divalent cation tolerance protein
MGNNSCCVVLTTTGSKKNAYLIAEYLIKKKLAACVQIDKVESFFFYEGSYKKADEFRLMIKALSSKYKMIEQEIKQHHDYLLPQIVKLDISEGLPEYLSWVYEK